MDINRINEIIEKEIEMGTSPSINLGVIYHDTKYFKSSGYKIVEPVKIKNDLDTLYDLASVSKCVSTTTLILKMMEMNILTLDTKVKDLLPEFKYDDILIRHLINHTTGFQADIPGYRNMSEEELYHVIFNGERVTPLNTKVNYSDINFILLGIIINRYLGPLKEMAHKYIFDPLDMVDTDYDLDSSLVERCAACEVTKDRGLIRGVVHDGKCYKLGKITGHAGVFSTVSDISNFCSMILHNGVYKNKQILSKKSIDLLFESTTTGLNESRSLGWILGDHAHPIADKSSEHTLFHTGFAGGSILIDRDNDVAIILLTNRVHPTRESRLIIKERRTIHNEIYEALGI